MCERQGLRPNPPVGELPGGCHSLILLVTNTGRFHLLFVAAMNALGGLGMAEHVSYRRRAADPIGSSGFPIAGVTPAGRDAWAHFHCIQKTRSSPWVASLPWAAAFP